MGILGNSCEETEQNHCFECVLFDRALAEPIPWAASTAASPCPSRAHTPPAQEGVGGSVLLRWLLVALQHAFQMQTVETMTSWLGSRRGEGERHVLVAAVYNCMFP